MTYVLGTDRGSVEFYNVSAVRRIVLVQVLALGDHRLPYVER